MSTSKKFSSTESIDFARNSDNRVNDKNHPKRQVEPYATTPVQLTPPLDSSVVTGKHESSQGPLSLREFRRLVADLETRIATCERFIGDPTIIKEALKAKPSSEAESGGKTPRSPAFDVLDMRSTEWNRDVEFAVSDKVPVAIQLERVVRLTDQVFYGRPAEFEKKLSGLKSWMEAENANVSQLILSHQAKKTYIFQNELRIRETIALLKQLDDLKDYINPSSFASLVSHKERISKLEQDGLIIIEKAKRLYSNIEELCIQHSSAKATLNEECRHINSLADEYACCCACRDCSRERYQKEFYRAGEV